MAHQPAAARPAKSLIEGTGAALVPARVRKLTDAQYAPVIGNLLPQVKLPNVATPGSELSLIKDSSMLDNTLIVFFSDVSIIGDGIDAQHGLPPSFIMGNPSDNFGGLPELFA
jgi:hypothetical protein